MKTFYKEKIHFNFQQIFLSGFANDEKDLLMKILNFGGASRFDELTDQVSHVLIGEKDENDMSVIKQENLT